jgi:guanidinobutyrase
MNPEAPLPAAPASSPEGDDTMWSTLLHAGIGGTFMGFPYSPAEAEKLKQAGAKVAVYGIPWDSTSISKTGANYGPRGMREVSAQFLRYNADLDFDLGVLSPVDCGDVAVIPGNAEKTFAKAQRDIGEILAAGALPVVLGGDHSITIPAVRAVAEKYDRPSLVLVDTHLDTAIDMAGESLNHCCPVSRAVDAGFPPENIVLIGINGWQNPRSELEYCREHGITVITLREIWRDGVQKAVEKTLEVAGVGSDGIYMSVDIDVLDTAYAPGCCTPTPAGLTSRELIEIVEGVSAAGLVGVDVAEVAPTLETESSTTKIGVRAMVDAIAFNAGAKYA